MNRRNFLQLIAAASASHFAKLDLPKIKPARAPVRLEYDGFIFSEDPSPLRFIITPEGPNSFVAVEYEPPTCQREYALNPAWVDAEQEPQPQFCFHPGALRPFTAAFHPGA